MSDPYGEVVKRTLSTEFHYEGSIEFEGEQIEAVHPLAWFPDNNAWEVLFCSHRNIEINVSRNQLRRVPELSALHKYLVDMSLAGMISRLEAVSMLPPLFLDVQPDDVVLDLCAAPGSKTQQILESLEEGIVIANEPSLHRAAMLVNQTSHIPTINIAVTSYLGQDFPSPADQLFDRVLCDVPCSGDGTLVDVYGGFDV